MDNLEKELSLPAIDDFELTVLDFIKEWKSGQDTFSIQTSGSTGVPQKLSFTRPQMIRSAERSIDYFSLKPGKSILLCLNPSFIAGKMMLVRALVGKLELVATTPSSNPFQTLDKGQFVDFAAVTSMQIESALQDSPDKIQQVRKILIGGAGIHPELEAKLRQVTETDIYHSFSMTETITHIAIRKINKVDRHDVFEVLKGVDISVDDRSCLAIMDTHLGIKKVVTNDIVEIVNATSFRWIGRYDHVVNSGGVKIQIEEVEQLVGKVLTLNGRNNRFQILAIPDPRLSEMLVLLFEGNIAADESKKLLDLLKNNLPKYHAPKKLFQVPKLFITKSGKIDRIKNAREYLGKNVA